MIKFEHTEIVGLEPALRGMRNPMESWALSDSYMGYDEWDAPKYSVGKADLTLMNKLAAGGPVHAKYRRMIVVYVDITAPLYWWKEFDTYKIGTVANSCSTMHKIHAKEFTRDDFSHEHLLSSSTEEESLVFEGFGDELVAFSPRDILDLTIKALNRNREAFLKVTAQLKDNNDGEGFDPVVKQYLKDRAKTYWWQMIQLLPSSYNQKRTIMTTYEMISNALATRDEHKQDEWRVGFCEWGRSLPYAEIMEPKKIVNEKKKEEKEVDLVDAAMIWSGAVKRLKGYDITYRIIHEYLNCKDDKPPSMTAVYEKIAKEMSSNKATIARLVRSLIDNIFKTHDRDFLHERYGTPKVFYNIQDEPISNKVYVNFIVDKVRKGGI